MVKKKRKVTYNGRGKTNPLKLHYTTERKPYWNSSVQVKTCLTFSNTVMVLHVFFSASFSPLLYIFKHVQQLEPVLTKIPIY